MTPFRHLVQFVFPTMDYALKSLRIKNLQILVRDYHSNLNYVVFFRIKSGHLPNQGGARQGGTSQSTQTKGFFGESVATVWHGLASVNVRRNSGRRAV